MARYCLPAVRADGPSNPFWSNCADESFSTAEVPFSGQTDPWILRETLTKAQYSPDQVEALVPQALALYASRVRFTAQETQVLPGVRRLLQRLSLDPTVQLGLLTGNLESTAYQKLSCVGLDRFFPTGAFGSDDADRLKLPAVAVARAWSHCGYAL